MTMPLPPPDDFSDEQLLALAARAAALPDAPPQQVAAAIGLWATRREPLLQRVLAVLRFDSLALPPQALGVRGGAALRHLLFSAEGRDIDLRIEPAAAGTFVLQGQVLGPDTAATLWLDGGATAAQTTLDELGGFRFDAVAAGRYTLALHTERQRIELPPLVLGDPPP